MRHVCFLSWVSIQESIPDQCDLWMPGHDAIRSVSHALVCRFPGHDTSQQSGVKRLQGDERQDTKNDGSKQDEAGVPRGEKRHDVSLSVARNGATLLYNDSKSISDATYR